MPVEIAVAPIAISPTVKTKEDLRPRVRLLLVREKKKDPPGETNQSYYERKRWVCSRSCQTVNLVVHRSSD